MGAIHPYYREIITPFCEKSKWNRLISAIFSRRFRNFGCRKESHHNHTFFPIEIAGQTHSQKTVNSIFKNIGCLNGIRSDNKNRSPQRLKKGENIFKHKDGWQKARCIKGYKLSGKLKCGFCYDKTRKEAKERAAKHKAASLAGDPPQTGACRRIASLL